MFVPCSCGHLIDGKVRLKAFQGVVTLKLFEAEVHNPGPEACPMCKTGSQPDGYMSRGHTTRRARIRPTYSAREHLMVRSAIEDEARDKLCREHQIHPVST